VSEKLAAKADSPGRPRRPARGRGSKKLELDARLCALKLLTKTLGLLE
jgi:hypothetical protein